MRGTSQKREVSKARWIVRKNSQFIALYRCLHQTNSPLQVSRSLCQSIVRCRLSLEGVLARMRTGCTLRSRCFGMQCYVRAGNGRTMKYSLATWITSSGFTMLTMRLHGKRFWSGKHFITSKIKLLCLTRKYAHLFKEICVLVLSWVFESTD